MAITQIRGAQVLDLTIDTTDLAASSVTEAKLNTSVAGEGISGGGGSALALEISEVTSGFVDVAADRFIYEDASAANATRNESITNLVAAVAGNALTATSGVLDVLVDSAEITSGAVDVDHLSDLRVTEGTGLIADFAAGTIRVDDGATVTVVSVGASTTTVADNDTSFVEVDSAGSVTNNVTGFTQGRIPLAEVTAVTGDITVVTDKRAWLDLDPGATGLLEANFVDNEVPTGDLDGADVTYTLANTPSPATSLKVYLNGIRQDEGAGDDYTQAAGVITFAAAPISTDKVLADYRF